MNATLLNEAGPQAGETTTQPPFHITSTPAAEPVEMIPRLFQVREILVPIDFSETSLKALQYAVAFAKQFDAKLTLVHVVELGGYTPELPYPAPLGPEEEAATRKQL